jgi:hypothetical protein
VAPSQPQNDNGVVKFLGISIDRWVTIVQTVGMPTMFMAFVMYLAWIYIPPVVAGHVELLEKTGQTLDSMDRTLQQSNMILREVNEVEKDTKVFMQGVKVDHEKFCKKLDENGGKLDTVIDQTKAKP